MDIAVLGLGEAGARYAADLVAAGASVAAFDPAPAPTPAGVARADSIAAAVADARLVIGFTGARFAEQVAAEASPALAPGAVFADFNTGSPEVKVRIGRSIAAGAGVPADVAVLAPVPRAGARTPLLVSGPGAEDVASYFRTAVDAPAEAFPGPMGAAAARKLLRSVFMKGLAAVVIEADEAGRIADDREWLRGQMAGELGPGGAALVERLIDGTRQHAERRLHEMEDARDYLASLGAEADMTTASTAWLGRLSREGAAA